jgi:hypothetical protein
VWAFAITGDEAIVEVHGGHAMGYGYIIDAVAHGTRELGRPPPESIRGICGTNDGREDVACHEDNTDFWAAQEPVAQLLVQDLKFGSWYICTGWLVAGPVDNTLITTNTCIASQDRVEALQASFNVQSLTCNPPSRPSLRLFALTTVSHSLRLTRCIGKDGQKDSTTRF